MGSLLTRVRFESVTYGSASGPELFGLLGVAREGDSSAKGRAARRPRL